MKNVLKLLIISFFVVAPLVSLKAEAITDRLKGKILLQVEDKGQAWYVEPKTGERHYMANGDEAYNIMRNLGVGITNKDLEKIQKSKSLATKHSGKIFLQVESKGEAFYVDFSGNLHYLKNGSEAYGVMRNLGLGVTNKNLSTIRISGKPDISKNNPTNLVDSDNDGLSDVEEDRLGTNKNKYDTDGDNVPDGYDDHPLEVGVKINKVIKLHNKYGNEFGVTLNIPMDYYTYLKTKKSHDMGSNLENISSFVTPLDPYIIELRNKINILNEELRQKSWDTKGFNDINYIVATDETQILEINYYSPDINTGYDEYPKYPIETIIDGSGDCEDLAFLGASLKVSRIENTKYEPIDILGIKGNKPTVALIIYPSHVAIGYAYNEEYQFNHEVEVLKEIGENLRFYNFNGKKFIYIEPTNSHILNIPDELWSEKAKIVELN